MKLPRNLAVGLALALLLPLWAGCQTHPTPISNGYEEVAHPYHAMFDEPPPPRVAFQHRGTNDTVTPIWPALYGVSDVIKGNLAIFVADKAYFDPDRVTQPRLFAVKSPDLPLDITDEVLRQWSKITGKNFTKARDRFTLATPTENDGRLDLQLEFWSNNGTDTGRDDWPEHGSLQLDWAQVEQIIQTVKTSGVPMKDLRWGTPYIGERF